MTSPLLIRPAVRALAITAVALLVGLAAADPVAALPDSATKHELWLRENERRVLVKGARAARIALRAVGTPYRWGGSSRAGFDCSGLTMWAYERVGVPLPHRAASQANIGRRIARSRLRPGDLLFFRGYGHVGMYLGRGRMVHAPQSGEYVQVISLVGRYGRRLVEIRRVAV
jgi:cell wall-associated NlpC family hydrolase